MRPQSEAVPAPGAISVIISDFGGVLTSPLVQSFAGVQDETGIPMEELGKAMARIEAEDGKHPLFELETGRVTEDDFLARLADSLEPAIGHRPEMHRFSELYFARLSSNEPMIDLMRDLKAAGYTMAMLTNNVKEWEARWRSMLPVDEIFELVVDSAFVGMRKPEPEIYELTLERLGNPDPASCLFIDDIEANIEAARALGLNAVHFIHQDQAMADIRAALA